MKPAAKGLLVAYVTLVPLGWSSLPFNAKWCDLVLVALAISVLGRGWRAWRPNPLDWLVALYILGSVVAIRPEFGWTPGLVAVSKELAVVLVYLVFAAAARNGEAELTARAIVIAATAFAVAGIAALIMFAATGRALRPLGVPMMLPYAGYTFRLYGATDSPELFACFLTFAIPLAIVPATRLSARARGASLVAMAIAGIATFAHSFAGGVLASVLSYRPSPSLRVRRALRSLLLAASLLAIVVVNVALIVTVRDLSFSGGRRSDVAAPDAPYLFQDAQGAPTATFRLTYNWMSYVLLKRVAMEAFLAAPWRGQGLGRFHDLTERAYAAGLVHEGYRNIDPHSTLMGRLAETGTIGGITLVALWVGAFAAVRRLELRPSTRALAIGLLGGFAGLAVNAVNVDVMNFRFLWIGFGLVRGLDGAHERHPEQAAV